MLYFSKLLVSFSVFGVSQYSQWWPRFLIDKLFSDKDLTFQNFKPYAAYDMLIWNLFYCQGLQGLQWNCLQLIELSNRLLLVSTNLAQL